MKPLTRRIVVTAVGGLVLLSVYALVYQWGMATFQGEDIGYVRSLQVVVEILTTAGFGGDAPWSSTGMSVIVIGMNVTGVLLVFFAIPYFVIPLLKRALQTEVPTETDLTNHVIVCADSPRETALEAEIGERNVPELFVKQDESRVMDLVRDGVDAIHGDPETAATLTAANVEQARAMIVDINDEVNANIVLTARRLNEQLQIVSVVEDSDTEQYHSYAGADDVIRPRVAVGKRLAMKAQGTRFREYTDDERASIALSEVLVESGSDLIGRTLAECRFRQRFGVTVLGGWFHGEFVAPVPPDRRLVEHAEAETLDQFQIVQTRVPALDGRALGDTEMRTADGVQVVAVERDGRLRSDLDPSFRFQADDVLLLAGDERDLARFERT